MTEASAKASPELAHLLTLLRGILGTGDFRPPAGEMEWGAFLALVERHRLGALLHRRANAAMAPHLPAPVATRLAALARTTSQRALQLAGEQLRLSRALEREGIAVIGVKGLPLAQRLYGEQGVRHVGDIDLLVREEDVEKADRVLQGEGLRRVAPGFALTPRQQRCFLKAKSDFEYLRPDAAIRIELLWRLEGLPMAEDLWQRMEVNPLARTLPPKLDAFYVIHHGARHGWFRLFWLFDAALLLRDQELDWDSLAATARRLDMALPLLQAAELARQLLNVTTPPALAPKASERRRVTALVAEAYRRIVREPRIHEGVAEWARQLLYRVRLQQTLPRRWRVLMPHLNSPESWRALPLPDRWFFLYPVITPWLWLGRRWASQRQSSASLAEPPASAPGTPRA